MSEPLVIIGNGMAAARLVENLGERALGKYAIAVVGDEPRLAYNRVLLSSVLAGDVASSDIELKPERWWRDKGVTLSFGQAATSVDTNHRRVHRADGSSVPYAKLIFATGSNALRLKIPGEDLEGVHTFRDICDVDRLLQLAASRKRIVVIGGGLLGLEAAYGLSQAGASVTLFHLMDRLMERQLDASAATLLKRTVEAKGIDVTLNANTTRILGRTTAEAVEINNNKIIPADAVVFAAGIQPNIKLAEDAGILVKRGIVVDDQMQTNIPDVYALGECAEHKGICYGLVEPAYEQARILADALAGQKARYDGSVTATNLKVSGINVFSAGNFLGEQDTEILVLTDSQSGIYKKLVIANDRLIGAILVGDTQDAIWYSDLIRSGSPVHTMRNELMFGRALAERKAA
jgi:nitrite reductase (NADH) large subunit